MMKWMEITRISRWKYLSECRNTFTSTTLLNRYPRLRDMPEAVSKFQIFCVFIYQVYIIYMIQFSTQKII
jgi:hypothetical protein